MAGFTPGAAPLWEDQISGNTKEIQQESSRWACARQRRSDRVDQVKTPSEYQVRVT